MVLFFSASSDAGIFRLTNNEHMLIIAVETHMARPHCPRLIAARPEAVYFKPRGIPMSNLEEVIVTVDEYEALRLADREGLYQDQAAGRMGVSRATFGRILESAHRKVAEALVCGMAIRIEGGVVAVATKRVFECRECGKSWEEPFGTGRPTACPHCGSKVFGRVDAGGGEGRGRRGQCWGAGRNAKESEAGS